MISSLKGTVIHKDSRFVVLDVGGVGYKVYTTPDTLASLKEAGAALLWTHLAVREDALDLYGFPSKDDVDFFELLLTVTGIGPKTGLSVLTIATVPTLKRAISTDDPSYLTKVSGVGKKMAEKIVRELKDKLIVSDEDHTEADRDEGDSLEALKAIGYAERQAREALKKVPEDITDMGERIKRAIKILGEK